MLPHTQEDIHFHHSQRQFFCILRGEAEMEFAGKAILLNAGSGMEIDPFCILNTNSSCLARHDLL